MTQQDQYNAKLAAPPAPRVFQTICLRHEILEYRRSVFNPMAADAVERSFRAVIKQLQPKQWRAVKIDFRTPKHAYLAVSD